MGLWDTALRYSLALACVALAFSARLLLESTLQDQAPFLLFIPALLVAGVFSGVGPALLATILSLVLGLFFFAKFPALSKPESILVPVPNSLLLMAAGWPSTQ
jgi:K+-sensing histidine kinase KdpD